MVAIIYIHNDASTWSSAMWLDNDDKFTLPVKLKPKSYASRPYAIIVILLCISHMQKVSVSNLAGPPRANIYCSQCTAGTQSLEVHIYPWTRVSYPWTFGQVHVMPVFSKCIFAHMKGLQALLTLLAGYLINHFQVSDHAGP